MNGLHLTFYIILKVKHVFPLLYSQRVHQTAYIPSCTMKTTSKVPSEHTQSLDFMNIDNFSHTWMVFHQSNSILPEQTLLHHMSFPCKQPAFYHLF